MYAGSNPEHDYEGSQNNDGLQRSQSSPSAALRYLSRSQVLFSTCMCHAHTP